MTDANSITFERAIPVRQEVHVFVAGGGPAGTAAALASNQATTTRGIDVAELQRRLKAMGAYLPNA